MPLQKSLKTYWMHLVDINNFFLQSCWSQCHLLLTPSNVTENRLRLAYLREERNHLRSLHLSYFLLEIVCFLKEIDGAISILSCNALKLVDQLTYLGTYISSAERDANICIGKMGNSYRKVIDHMEIWCIGLNKTRKMWPRL